MIENESWLELQEDARSIDRSIDPNLKEMNVHQLLCKL